MPTNTYARLHRDGDHARNNLINMMNHQVINDEWFDDHEEDLELYSAFLDDFADWLLNEGEDVGEYPNKSIDITDYFKSYMADKPCEEMVLLYNDVAKWLDESYEYAISRDFTDNLYLAESAITDIEFYTYDIAYNAEKIFRKQNYTEEDITHGFKSPKDLIEAVNEVVDNQGVETYDVYDAGGMGHHDYDGSGDYFETGHQWLGNGQEEYQLDSKCLFKPGFEAENLYDIPNSDLIYATSTNMYCYGVKWEDVEEAGDKLGLRN